MLSFGAKVVSTLLPVSYLFVYVLSSASNLYLYIVGNAQAFSLHTPGPGAGSRT